MKEFSFNRMGKVLAWYLKVNWKWLAIWTLGALLGIYLLQMFFAATFATQMKTAFILEMLVAISSFAIMVVLFVMFAQIFERIKTKQKAISFLMLPATNAEKYAVLMLVITVVFPLCMLLAFMLGDTLRGLSITLFTGEEFLSGIPVLPRVYGNGILESIHHFKGLMMACFVVISFIWLHSLYVWGGSVFRKNAFGIITLFFLLLEALVKYSYKYFWGDLLVINQDGDATFSLTGYLLMVIMIVWACYNYRSSYRIFTRLQVINNKRTNL